MNASDNALRSAGLTRRSALGLLGAGAGSALVVVNAPSATAHGSGRKRHPAPAALTNLTHLEFLLDDVPLSPSAEHSTYDIDSDPVVLAPWTYADRNDDGSYTPVGGGDLDPETGDYTQGAYNADDTSRAAVVFIRHWQATGEESSRDHAYQTLRALAFHQTLTGPDAGNVVLWQQADGSLNRSALPIELPDPSDSDESYWLARTVWAFGEGYEAFAADEQFADFAAFLRDRLALCLTALRRASLGRYGIWEQSDGRAVPGWLIANGADATAEAVLGLSAYVRAEPGDGDAGAALDAYAQGVAAMSSGGVGRWPFGALMPWALSQSFWHGWGAMLPAALGVYAGVRGDRDALRAAAADVGLFTPQLFTSGGPFNAWSPVPGESQIAYGADCRLAGLLAVADQTGGPGLELLAGLAGGWFFGANPAGRAVYDPATGVTFDGVEPDGHINTNSGAESTIHGQLAMIALDAHPHVSALAQSITGYVSYDGLRPVEAEDGDLAGGAELVEPESAWTGEGNWSGGAYVSLPDRASVRIAVDGSELVAHPIVHQRPDASGHLEFRAIDARGRARFLGRTANAGGDPQGIAENEGLLLPLPLERRIPAGTQFVEVSGHGGEGQLDALLVHPPVTTAQFATASGPVVLYANTSRRADRLDPLAPGRGSTFDRTGRNRGVVSGRSVWVSGAGFTITGPEGWR